MHAALCDNFDTPRAIAALRELIGHANKYTAARAVRGRAGERGGGGREGALAH